MKTQYFFPITLKKIKLLTSLTSIGAIAIATPIVTTSCSGEKTAEVSNIK